MNQRNPRNEKQWEYVQEWMGSPKGVSMLLGFAAIWALTGFNPWVAFGLSMGALGSARKYAENRRRDKIDEFLDRAEEWNDWEESKKSTFDETLVENQKAVENLPIHKKVIEDAQHDLAQIKAASAVASGEIGANLQSIVKNSESIERDLQKEPHKLSQVQRIFTYYIPATQDLLFARGKALANNDTVKLAEIDAMLARLALAFGEFKEKMHGEDARSIDIDIKLLEQSLQQDLSFEIRNRDRTT